jgi:hypothetical protein
MRISNLVWIEIALLIGAAVILYLILANPFASDGPEDAVAAKQTPAGSTATVTPPATATPKPTPDLLRCGATIDAAYMANTQIVSYYGNPYTAQMGILGELEPEELIAQVKARAAAYDALNGIKHARPALHIVYGTAQEHPGNSGLHLLYVDDETMEDYIELACDHGLLVFIDLQIGRSTVAAEVERVIKLLEYPHVHLAIDPEFAMPAGEVPGESIGSIDADDINDAQAMVSELIDDAGLSDKIVVVHRFTDGMITRSELIENYPRVRLVIDMDGFGPSDVKIVKYGWYAKPAEYSGIKLFFKHDTPLLTEAEVLELEPDIIIYQ